MQQLQSIDGGRMLHLLQQSNPCKAEALLEDLLSHILALKIRKIFLCCQLRRQLWFSILFLLRQGRQPIIVPLQCLSCSQGCIQSVKCHTLAQAILRYRWPLLALSVSARHSPFTCLSAGDCCWSLLRFNLSAHHCAPAMGTCLSAYDE